MTSKIYVAQISLHYEERPTVIHYWSREKLSQKRLSEKGKNKDWYFKRVTANKADQLKEETDIKEFNKSYDAAIMKKYNIGSDYKNNRWFMEQVRPTLN